MSRDAIDELGGRLRAPDPGIEETESRFRTMADQAPVLLWMAGRDGLCDFFNQTWLEFTGRTRAEEVGNGWAEGVHPEDFSRSMQVFLEAFVARRPFAMEYRLRRHDGEYRWIFDQGSPRFDGEGGFLGFIGSCVDITAQRQAREALGQLNRVLEERVRERTALAAEREMLLREVHHRVKNDLQLISSLLGMHGRELADTGSAHAFEECQERVQAIARVHEYMYQSSDLHEMCFSEHLRALTLEVRETGAPPPGVELVLDIGERVWLRVDQAIPCAMIVHELLVNAFKHAFPGGRRGEVRVACRDEGEGTVAVSVEDDGIGMTSLTGAHGTGLGWTLVDAFVRQLDAQLDFDISRGTSVRLRFGGARAEKNRAARRAAGAPRAAPVEARGAERMKRSPEAEAE
ncbi:MAG TPA: PAS domain S-box protein [Polyangiaceae bacterium]|nr:PAS domain S-box protein [Polyangiaceae bacterium]